MLFIIPMQRVVEGIYFDSWSRHYDFRDWLSPASKLLAERSLKRRKSSKQPTKGRGYKCSYSDTPIAVTLEMIMVHKFYILFP